MGKTACTVSMQDSIAYEGREECAYHVRKPENPALEDRISTLRRLLLLVWSSIDAESASLLGLSLLNLRTGLWM